jgi:hypothetical protein
MCLSGDYLGKIRIIKFKVLLKCKENKVNQIIKSNIKKTMQSA